MDTFTSTFTAQRWDVLDDAINADIAKQKAAGFTVVYDIQPHEILVNNSPLVHCIIIYQKPDP